MAKMNRFPIRIWSDIDEFRIGYQETDRRIEKLPDISTHDLFEGPAPNRRRSNARPGEATSTYDAHLRSIPTSEPKFYRLPTLIFSTLAVGMDHFRFQIKRKATIPNDANYYVSRINAKDYDYNAKIFDLEGRHCGMFVGDIEHLPYDSETSTDFAHGEEWKWDFVWMSRVERSPARHYMVWMTYFNYFNEEIFGPEKAWDCVNVLLVKWEGEYAERFAVARIHVDAFINADPVDKVIRLN